MIGRVCLFLVLCLVAGAFTQPLRIVDVLPEDDPEHRVQTLHNLCEADALCRTVFQQEHGELSETRFRSLLQHIPPIALSSVDDTDSEMVSVPLDVFKSLVVNRMTLQRHVMSESHCPPNQYWHWNATTEMASCRCYLDRDCRGDVLALCLPETHPILLVAFLIVIFFGVVSVFINNCYPSGVEKERRKKRV